MPDCLLILERKQSGSKVPDSPEFEYVMWYDIPPEFHKAVLPSEWRFDWNLNTKVDKEVQFTADRVSFKLVKYDTNKHFAWYIEV